MEWPAHSPDLNPMENLWGIAARAAHARGRQFENKEDLKNCIAKEWNDISPSHLASLRKSMKKRCLLVMGK